MRVLLERGLEFLLLVLLDLLDLFLLDSECKAYEARLVADAVPLRLEPPPVREARESRPRTKKSQYVRDRARFCECQSCLDLRVVRRDYLRRLEYRSPVRCCPRLRPSSKPS